MSRMQSSAAVSAAFVIVAVFGAPATRAAEQTPATADSTYGTTASPAVTSSDLAAMKTPISSAVATAGDYANAQYATGGAALRNRGTSALSISGVNTPVKAAFLYWAVIDNGAPLAGENKLTLKRLAPAPIDSAVLTGAVVGQGPSPCWGGTKIVVYKATVPTSFASDNGTYQVSINPAAAGVTNGSDPFAAPIKFPLWDGASLVMIGTGTKRVSLFDKGLAGSTFNDTLRYSLQLPVAATAPVLFDNIAADGQVGSSRKAVRGRPGKTTVINNYLVAGPKSFVGDSDWDGSSGWPLPQLWDDTGHDITPAAQGFRTLNVSVTPEPGPAFDCATPVANVVQY